MSINGINVDFLFWPFVLGGISSLIVAICYLIIAIGIFILITRLMSLISTIEWSIREKEKK
jgi:uncharacterized protein YoxC